MPSFQCQSCGAPVRLAAPIPRDAECDACRHDVRCCRNCRHYDTRYNNACKETEAEPVADKERRNFCEFFSFNPAPFRPATMDKSREAQARAKLEGLFKGGANTASPDRATDARAKLDALFKKPPTPES